jgi:hypothetical protein
MLLPEKIQMEFEEGYHRFNQKGVVCKPSLFLYILEFGVR